MIVVALTALSVFFLYRRLRQRLQAHCYLRHDLKPQQLFKRVLADNTYSPFNHLNVGESNGGDKNLNPHPYEAEITALLESRPSELKCVAEDLESEMSEDYVWVETEA